MPFPSSCSMLLEGPDVMAFRECLEAHKDIINHLYLTDSEASLKVIHKWVG
jgi:hypothetical protein